MMRFSGKSDEVMIGVESGVDVGHVDFDVFVEFEIANFPLLCVPFSFS